MERQRLSVTEFCGMKKKKLWESLKPPTVLVDGVVEVSRCWDSCGCSPLHGADTLASWDPSSDINYGMLRFRFPHWQYTVYARADSRTDSRTDSRKGFTGQIHDIKSFSVGLYTYIQETYGHFVAYNIQYMSVFICQTSGPEVIWPIASNTGCLYSRSQSAIHSIYCRVIHSKRQSTATF
ncbi:hypothetical protein EYR41_005802 [Orbilia oligospora]|uniref:Uncharacterized protein n=1 Tax=Orbilia oligospora TaxID=2813651 RepID=A0A7C8PXX4_ORBOL|nr:hypothetical protein TWF751_004366 [Orbilia oligospora]TGJ69784.1 hypothetical protein EYR41_005802 [Orbilia oligospora]